MRLLLCMLLSGVVAAQQVGYELQIQRLGSPDPKVRRESAEQLGELGDRRAIPALGGLVKDLDEETRFRAVEALAKMFAPDTVPFLSAALRDPSGRVKQTAIEGLVTVYVGPQDSGGLRGFFNRAADLFRHSDEDLVVAPGTVVDPRAVEALANALTDPDGQAAKSAARALGVLRSRAALPAMSNALASAPREVQTELLRAFQKIRDPQPAPQVAGLLGSSDRDIRGLAAYTLGLLGARQQWPALRRLFEADRERSVRRSAFEALSLMPAPEQAAWFAGFLQDKDERLREFSADALGRLPQAEPKADLDRTLRSRHTEEKSARGRLALAFALVARGQGEFLSGLMDSLDSSLYRGYGRAYLIELGRDATRLPSYYPYLRSEKANVRRYLCEVFGALANPAALPQVKPLVNDGDTDVATAAVRAVQIMMRFQ
jgi:HEAT repeat protein